MKNIYLLTLILYAGHAAFAQREPLLLPPSGDCQNVFCHSNGLSIISPVLPTGYKFAVGGKGIMEGLKIRHHTKWPDYVFDKDYPLLTVPELKNYIAVNGHLPDAPDAETVKQNGIVVEEINALLLRKIEEMSLYLIRLQERINALSKQGESILTQQRAERVNQDKTTGPEEKDSSNDLHNRNAFLANLSPSICENIHCNTSGGVSIGTLSVPSGYVFALGGKAIMEGLKIELQSKWPDYVFEKSYPLIELPELKSYVARNRHLPNVPTAEEVKRKGIDLETINVTLLQKIEEMSLYLIQMEERLAKIELAH